MINIDLRHLIMMVARALDYVGIDDLNHGHRVGYIAYECAKVLGWANSRQEFIFLAGLLHDCGVSSTSEHLRLLEGMEPEGTEGHCIRGYKYLQECLVLQPFANVVRHHHTRWDKLVDIPEMDGPDRDSAALVFLADRVDIMRARYMDDNHPNSVILYGERIAENVMEYSGKLFNPEHAEAMAELVLKDGFWFTMEQAFIEDIGSSFGQDQSYDMPLMIEEVINLAKFMSRIVDAKSPFTYQHSENVAKVATELAADFELDTWDQQQIQVAALLHDMGKLKVPDSTLHKPDHLDDHEYSTIKRHVVDTKLALRNCFIDSPIPDWAANHHERIDGSGYPYRLSGEQLDLPSRIIAIADIFQALAQDRPYRGRLNFDEISSMMKKMVDENQLDSEVYNKIETRPDHYYDLATHYTHIDHTVGK